MSPIPTKEEMDQRGLLDPELSQIHVVDLVHHAKDGIYARDKLSDHVIGMLLWGVAIGAIVTWEGTLFQVPFVKGMKLRSNQLHLGRPFLGPDGGILTLSGVTLCGAEEDPDIELSPLTADTLLEHHEYNDWLSSVLYGGGDKDSTSYNRIRTENSLKACDAHTNSSPYSPGPLTIMPPATASGPGNSSSSRVVTPRRKADSKKKPLTPAVVKSEDTATGKRKRANKGKAKVAGSSPLSAKGQGKTTTPKNPSKRRPSAKVQGTTRELRSASSGSKRPKKTPSAADNPGTPPPPPVSAVLYSEPAHPSFGGKSLPGYSVPNPSLPICVDTSQFTVGNDMARHPSLYLSGAPSPDDGDLEDDSNLGLAVAEEDNDESADFDGTGC